MQQRAEPVFLVKVCGVTTEEDACAAAESGASAIGFNFYPRSPRFLSTERAPQIAAVLPPEILRVGVFVHPIAEEIYARIHDVPLDVIQIHGEVPALDPSKLAQAKLWRAIPVNANFRADQLAAMIDAEAFLFDSPTVGFGGSGKTFDWFRVQGITRRILIAGGLDGSNVAAAISASKPWGVDACSRIESEPGRKDLKKMREFVRAAREAFQIEMTLAR